MAASYWDESNLERVIETFNPSSFFGLPTDLFDRKGDLRYCNTKPLILTRGDWSYYTPFKGWVRYGLNIEKFGNSGAQWLACDGARGEWAVGFHGLRRDVLEVLKCIAFEGFKVFSGKNSEWGTTAEDVGPNASLFSEKTCGKGVFLTPKLEYLTENVENCRLTKPIQYNKHFYLELALQCRIHPKNIRVPACAGNQYYIVNDPKHVRPHGIVIYFLTAEKAKTIFDGNNYDLKPAIPFVEHRTDHIQQSISF